MHSQALQTIVKGFSNHYRIDVLRLLGRQPKLDVEDIANKLKANYKTISVHVRQMHSAGLIRKKYKGQLIEHTLTKRGEVVLRFLGKLE